MSPTVPIFHLFHWLTIAWEMKISTETFPCFWFVNFSFISFIKLMDIKQILTTPHPSSQQTTESQSNLEKSEANSICKYYCMVVWWMLVHCWKLFNYIVDFMLCKTLDFVDFSGINRKPSKEGIQKNFKILIKTALK